MPRTHKFILTSAEIMSALYRYVVETRVTNLPHGEKVRVSYEMAETDDGVIATVTIHETGVKSEAA